LSVTILHQKCDPAVADDRTLPYNTYLVKYMEDDEVFYDLVMTNKKVDIFDYYWDRYREGLQWFKQSEGRINPKVWGNKPTEKKKRK
jgi:hypothetical protein